MTNPIKGNGIAPVKNNIFYGKLLDEKALKMEQDYFDQKRCLLNRLTLGSGVVCGLKLSVDGNQNGLVKIEPGVAIDGYGREIIVPEAFSFNPRRFTDDQGNPNLDAPLIDGGTVEICLIYAETLIDPVPILIPECQTPGDCAHGTIREGFRVVVRKTVELDDEQPPLNDLPESVDDNLHQFLCDYISASCPDTPSDACVPIAQVTIGEPDEIKFCTGRKLVYSNALLFELIFRLIKKVEGLEGP